MQEDVSESLGGWGNESGNGNGSRCLLWACMDDNGGRSGGGGGGSPQAASARVVPAACRGGTISAAHH